MDNTFDKRFYNCGDFIAGIDESGVVDIAGPIIAACVVFPKWENRPDDVSLLEIHDSKELNDKQREARLSTIVNNAVGIGIGRVDPNEIDMLGVSSSVNLAMARAIFNCVKVADKKPLVPDFIIVDGHKPVNLNIKQVAIRDADKKSISVAAASIIAKQERDFIMKSLHEQLPYYGWDSNKGHPCQTHFEGIDIYGIQLGIHRIRSWPFLGRAKEDDGVNVNHKKWSKRREKWKSVTIKNIFNQMKENFWSSKPKLLKTSKKN